MSTSRLRKWTGGTALAALILSLNLLVWTQQFFILPVLAPLGLAAVLGLVWLGLALMNLSERHAFEDRSLGGANALFASAVFLGICIVTYLIFGAWNASWDLTEEGRRDLSPQTVQVLQAMNTEVDVLCFFLQIEDELVAIGRDKTIRFLEECRRHTPLLKVESLDPTIDRARLEALNITHASVQGTIVLRAGERQRVITLTGGSPRLEERDFTNALINILRHAEPKVYFLTGHHERDILDEDEQQGGSILGNLLRGESYKVERLAIKLSDPEIPADADIIVMNNPSTDLHAVEVEVLDAFMRGGGRLLLLLNPWRSSASGFGGAEHLRPWLERRFGVAVGMDMVISDTPPNIWQIELSVDNTPFEGIEAGFMEYRGAFSLNHPITRRFDQTMLLQAVRSVGVVKEPPETTMAVELLRSPPNFWAETDTERLLRTGQAQLDEGERVGPLPLAVGAVMTTDKTDSPKGRSDARIVVVGDADFAANAQIIIPGHVNFLLNAFAWLSESEDLIAMRPTGREAAPLILTQAQQRMIAWVSIMLTVQVVIAMGLGVAVIRRKSQ